MPKHNFHLNKNIDMKITVPSLLKNMILNGFCSSFNENVFPFKLCGCYSTHKALLALYASSAD